MACFFHKWKGCKCEKCGKIRDAEHSWNGCLCINCGKTRYDGHILQDGKCSLCGTTFLSVSYFEADEIALIKQAMSTLARASGGQGNKEMENHARTLIELFGSLDSWFPQDDIAFINTVVSACINQDHSIRMIYAATYNKLVAKLLQPSDGAYNILKGMGIV